MPTRRTSALPGARFVLFVVCLSALAFSSSAQDAAVAVQALIEDFRSDDRVVRRKASLALSQMGPQAAPAVPDLIRGLEDRDDQVWFNSITALAYIGPAAKEAVPSLIRGLRGDGRYRSQRSYRAAFALGKIGKPALPALREALSDSDSSIRAGAAKALGWLQADAAPALPQLIGRFADESSSVQDAAAETVGRIGQPAVQPLIKALAASDEDTRWNAIYSLGEIGAEAAPAGKALLTLVASNENPRLQKEAIHASARINHAPKKLAEAYVALLNTDDEGAYETLVNALLRLRPAETSAVLALKQKLDSKIRLERERAAYILGRIGEPSGEAAPRLIELASAADADQRSIYTSSLVGVGFPAVPPLLKELEKRQPDTLAEDDWTIAILKRIGLPAFNRLRGSLGHKQASVRLACLISLRGIGPAAKDALPRIRRLINDPEARVRAEATLALRALGLPTSSLLPTLEKGITDVDPMVRQASARVLADLGDDAEPAVDFLVAALEDKDQEVRSHAVRALGSVGSAAGNAAPKLIAMLDSADGNLRVDIVRALGSLGSDAAEDAAPRLIQLADTRDPELKPVVFASLGKLGLRAQAALPAIRKSLNDAHIPSRNAALLAVCSLESDEDRLQTAVIAGLKDKSAQVRQTAAEAAGRHRLKSKDATLALFEMLDESEDRSIALAALRDMRVRDLDLLREALRNDSPGVRVFALTALSAMERDAEPALPEIRGLLKDRYDFVRRRARDAIKRIER